MMRGTMLMGHLGPGIMIFKLLGLIGIILIVISIILLVKYKRKKEESKETKKGPATETVKMLYAQGTIDEAEYSKRLAVLKGNAYIDTYEKETE